MLLRKFYWGAGSSAAYFQTLRVTAKVAYMSIYEAFCIRSDITPTSLSLITTTYFEHYNSCNVGSPAGWTTIERNTGDKTPFCGHPFAAVINASAPLREAARMIV